MKPTSVRDRMINSNITDWKGIRCTSEGDYVGFTGANNEFFVLSSGMVRVSGSDTGRNIYYLHPETRHESIVYITNFQNEYDQINLVAFPQLRSFEDLSYTTRPLTLYTSSSQYIVLANIMDTGGFNASTNIRFYSKADATDDDGGSGNSSMIEFSILGGVAFIFLFVGFAVKILSGKEETKSPEDPLKHKEKDNELDDQEEANSHDSIHVQESLQTIQDILMVHGDQPQHPHVEESLIDDNLLEEADQEKDNRVEAVVEDPKSSLHFSSHSVSSSSHASESSSERSFRSEEFREEFDLHQNDDDEDIDDSFELSSDSSIF
jgi:hypothetical protein